MIHKFKVTVIETREYLIEIDDEVMNEKFMAAYREDFVDLDTLAEHAEQLAFLDAQGAEVFFEGYGLVKKDGKLPSYAVREYGTTANSGVNIILVEEDVETESEEVVY